MGRTYVLFGRRQARHHGVVRRRILLSSAYVVLVAMLTLVSLSQQIAYYVRLVVLFPLSILLVLVDWWGGLLLFGPDPSGFLATAFFVGMAVATASLQALVAVRLVQDRERT